MTSLETIERLARLGNAREMTDFLLGLSADERDGLKDGVRKLVRKAQRDETFYTQAETEDAQKSKGFGREKATQAARLAALATLGISDLKKIRWSDSGEAEFWGYSHWEPWRLQKLRILEALKPAWIQEFAELLLTQSLDIWFFVRALIRRGLCQSLKSPQYTFGMALDMRRRRSTWYINDEIFERQLTIEQCFKNDLNSIEAALLEDEDLLKDDVWTLFDYEGDSRASLASLEAAAKPEDSWRETLVKLSNDARLSRERLINRCLDAIARDYKPYYAAWFLGLLKALKLTTEEVAANQERFLHFLGCSNPATIKLALENLAALQKAKLLDREKFVDSAEPAFRLSAKGTVNQALKLLEFSIKTNPALIQRGLEMATTALLNESVEVQAAVMTLLEKHPESRPILSAYGYSLAPTTTPVF